MAFPEQMRRLLGIRDTAAAGAPDAAGGFDATGVGLRDAVLTGWFNNGTGELFPDVPIAADDVVVDVGCGEGGTLAFCARRGAHVVAIDHDAAALERAREKIEPTSARRKEYHVSPAETLPVADATASRVICTEVLEHVDDPVVVLAELHRIGQPGALYLVSCPDPVQEGVQQQVAPPAYFQKPNHLRIIERDEFRRLVEGAGLEVIAQRHYGCFWSIWWAMFWACKVDLANPSHPALDHWAQAWQALLETPGGAAVKRALDQVLPKSQVIVARKPGQTG